MDAKLKFDDILNSVLRTDWSADAPPPDTYHVTMGTRHGGAESRKLSRLSSSDLTDLMNRTITSYSECEVATPLAILFPRLSPGREIHEVTVYLFQEVLEHIAGVDRVLSTPGGSLLLAGRSGVGRRTAVQLVAHVHKMEIVTLHITRQYSMKNFRQDLKNVSSTYCEPVHQVTSLLPSSTPHR